MLAERKAQLKTEFFSHIHTLLPLVAPFFMQLSCSVYLLDRLPLPLSLGPAIGLVISYLFGPVGFFFSAALWGTYLAVAHTELFSQATTIFFLLSCMISWWLSTLCSEQYQQRIIDLEEMISAIFNKNNELEKHAKDAIVTIREERKEALRQSQELEGEIDSLKSELSSHRHHLSLAWQESSSLKEEADKQRHQLVASLETAQSQSLFYLQQKQSAEGQLQELKLQLESLSKEKEEKQNNFLEEFRHFQERLDKMKADAEEKNAALIAMQRELELVKGEKNELQALALKTAHSSPSDGVQYETLYKQMKDQFEEKSETLSTTRRHLFAVENDLLVLQKRQQEQQAEENSDEASLISSLCQLVEECHDLQEQVAILEEILSSLQEKKKTPRTKKESSSAVDKLIDTAAGIQDSLFSL